MRAGPCNGEKSGKPTPLSQPLACRMFLFRRQFGETYEMGESVSDRAGLGLQNAPDRPGFLGGAAAAANQIDDYHHQRYHQQQVNQASGDVQAKPQHPQNQKYNNNRPKHISLLVIYS